MVERPELAVWIARVATGWSRIEERLGYIIVQLLGAEAHTGMKMYQALSGAGAQKAVLRALARDRLSQEMQDELEALLSDYKKVAGKRNKIVHGHWDTSENHPDELVWTDAADAALNYSEFWAGWAAAPDKNKRFEFARNFKGREIKRLLYSTKDFDEVIREIIVIGTKLSNFSRAVENLNSAPRKETSVRGK